MTSQIDTTVPVFGAPTTQSVRDNFTTAANEISTLQNQTIGSPFLPEAGGRMTGPMWLFNDPTDAMQPVTLQYAQVNFGAPGGAPAVPEAPVDGTAYGRLSGAWVNVVQSGGDTMTGLLLLSGDPTNALGAVTKQYADAISTAMLPDSPHDSTTYGRNNGAWVHTLAASGGQLTGSLGVGVAVPTTPAPAAAQLVATALSATSEIDLNAYPSSGTVWNYLANGSAARFNLPATAGTFELAVATTGTAGGAVTWGAPLTLDYKGNLTAGALNPAAIPTDTVSPAVYATQFVAPISGNGFLTNLYNSTGGYRYLAANYAMMQSLNSSGVWTLSVAPSGSASSVVGTWAGSISLGQNNTLSCGNLSVSNTASVAGDLTIHSLQASGFVSSVAAGQAIVTAYSTGNTHNAGFYVNGPQLVLADFDGSWASTYNHMYIQGGSITITNATAGKPGGGPWADSSDARIKQVDKAYEHGLKELTQLAPVVFRFLGNDPRHNADVTQTPFIGLVADDVASVFPECVSEVESEIDGKPVDDLKMLDTGPLTFAVINALKEIDARLRALEGRKR